jgi:subfamily B ATP-binding cassette protein MsbA
VLQLRQAMFERLLAADPGLFTRQHRQPADQHPGLRGAAGHDAADRRAADAGEGHADLVALLGYLLWLNWQLTLFVGLLFPARWRW